MKNTFQPHTARPSICNSPGLLLFILALTAIFLSGCKKLIDINPPIDQLVTSSVFKDSTTAQAVVNGMYSTFYNGQGTGTSYYSYRISLRSGESADELIPVQNNFDQFYTNSLTPNNGDVNDLWSQSYNIIYTANSIIEGMQSSTTLSSAYRKQLTAEAQFMRAFCTFYLVNYFGSVPLITKTDINATNNQPASAINDIYTQIISDLTSARDALAPDYSWSNGDRTRVNSYVASAMLARVYLYRGQWQQAETEATRVINNTSLYAIETDLNNVFLINSNEALLQFYNNVYGYTYTGQQLIPTGAAVPTYAINPILLNAFENGDKRKANWINSVNVLGSNYTYPFKYKANTATNTEYETAMRLAEQYLIRAEARAEQNNLSGAQSDLNVIRNRAGLANTTAADEPSLLLAVEHERQAELFCEWGHRWLDLKRTGRADAVLGTEKPSGWQSTDVLYPIPYSAISTNPNLKQNPGYH